MFDDATLQQLARKLATLINRPKPEFTERLMLTAKAADYLGMTESALRQRKSAGQIGDGVTVKIGGTIYYDRIKLDKWLDSLSDAA